VASIGGPLALATIYAPGAADLRSAGLLAVVGSALYALPLLVWLHSSRRPSGVALHSFRRRSGRSATSSTCRTR
jgi:hypothetical protein